MTLHSWSFFVVSPWENEGTSQPVLWPVKAETEVNTNVSFSWILSQSAENNSCVKTLLYAVLLPLSRCSHITYYWLFPQSVPPPVLFILVFILRTPPQRENISFKVSLQSFSAWLLSVLSCLCLSMERNFDLSLGFMKGASVFSCQTFILQDPHWATSLKVLTHHELLWNLIWKQVCNKHMFLFFRM